MNVFCSQIINGGFHNTFFGCCTGILLLGYFFAPAGARILEVNTRDIVFVNTIFLIFVGFVYLAPILDCLAR